MRTAAVIATSLRFDDAALYEAVRQYARAERRAVNAGILTLLEESLRAKGYLHEQQPAAPAQK